MITDTRETDDVETATEPSPGRKAPATVVNGTRVTVAFPFSHIQQTEPGAELQELAELVVELADAVATSLDDETAESLGARARALRDKLAGIR